ncbi:hypothetical protein [Azovibrio restrictus]|uniref:hypothetical protein n=1 Tax=Azovibrio restrictus TaxID=146938 RepID=UPI00040CA5C3|nr:hypothetical protein [Azovibrio restrictus]MCE1171290.1 hypothetical protein [Azovibrio sp.]
MDILDFSDCELYFEEPLLPEAERLLQEASGLYGDEAAELALLRAYVLAPEHLTVLVGLYRYYFYQHRLEDALVVAERAMQLVARRLGLPLDWARVEELHLAAAAQSSFGLLRFYLLALKASCVVLLRQHAIDAARARLQKLMRLDSQDQLGAAKLLEVVDEFRPRQEAEPALTLIA